MLVSTLDREDAARFMRVLEPDEQLNGIKMVPMAGNTVIPLGSLAAAEAFLKPTSAKEAAEMSQHIRIHYVDPGVLASWVRDIIGDAELAAGLDAIIASERAYGLMVPEMKQLLADRIKECRTVLDEHDQESQE